MKQKQVKVSSKVGKPTKAVKTTPPPKKVEEAAESVDDDEVVQKKVVAKKAVTKKAAKGKKVVEPEEDEDESENEDEDGNEESEDDNEVAEDNDEEAEDDNEEAEDDENGDNDEEDDDDEADESVSSDEPTIPSKVKSGPIPHTTPVKRVIHVTQLPKNCEQISIVEAFAKYGAIDQIHFVSTPRVAFANIAFKTAKAALAAIDDEVKLGDSLLSITEWKKEMKCERKVFVKDIKNKTTEEQIGDHFRSCGEIHMIQKNPKVGFNTVITFAEADSVQAALKLHNSILDGVNIKVYDNTTTQQCVWKENLTVAVRSNQNFESIEVSKIQSIFAKCGEIEYVDIICKGKLLAFVTFKTEDAAEKALKLSGKTKRGVELDIVPYSPLKKWTTINVTNLPSSCSIEELKDHFANAGEIADVSIGKGFAVIRFEDSEGFCKSFMYCESFFKGKRIFIEPYSKRKIFMKRGMETTHKRKFQNGSSFKANKKPRFNFK